METSPYPLRVWWIPNLPMQPYYVHVENISQAKLVLNALADYDIFLYLHHLKPDHSNAGGLEVFKDNEWSEWADDETGLSIDEYLELDLK